VPASIVLIASTEHLPILKQRPEFGEVQAFTDGEALRALDVITRQRPQIVVVERLFAATSRGAALINRIKADPTLGNCEIRIVAHDSNYSRVSPRRPTDPVPVPAIAVEEPPAVKPVDHRGTRRSQRFKMVDGIEVLVDGNPAALMDLSSVGAMVLSEASLKPNQRVRLSFPETPRPLRFSAGVVWAAFEMPKGKTGPHYRAGLEFDEADVDALKKFIDKNKK
jgi:hypothetical protein